jgi:glycosyltransferase involved in cell wall biosynthesis
MRVVHVISSLEVGGAERMLERLILSMQSEQNSIENIVISLSSGGLVGANLRQQGVEVIELKLGSFVALPLAIYKLARLFRVLRPAIVQSWMYRSDFIASISARLCGISRIAWGIRCTQIPRHSSIAVKALVRVNALLSRFLPHNIVCCAHSARKFHSSMGFDDTRMVVIPNGFDFSLFAPHEKDRVSVRHELGFDSEMIVIGIVGRYDELKDYGNFISAASIAAKENNNLRFLMIGQGLDGMNQTLVRQIAAAGLEQKIWLWGASSDVARMMRGIDIYCMSSRSEGFPNVVVEAMGTGLPCIVTDVGDAALIVGDCGAVVPPEDSQQLAIEMIRLAQLSTAKLQAIGRRSRDRAKQNYSLSAAMLQYQELYEKMYREVK